MVWRITVAVALLAAAGCGGDDRGPAPGLFESQGVIDWDPVATRVELAAQSDVVVLATLSGVSEGYVFGSSLDDEFGSPVLELLLDMEDGGEPMRLIWDYVPGYPVEEIEAVFPIGSRVVVFERRFVVRDSEQAYFHHIGPDDHEHWQWTNPQGLLVEDPDTGEISWYNPDVTFDDPPPAGAPLEAWLP